MAHTIGLDIGKCTGQPDTCPAVRQAMEADNFYYTIESLDPAGGEVRAMLGDFVTACAKGTCPGRNLELTQQVLRRLIERDDT